MKKGPAHCSKNCAEGQRKSPGFFLDLLAIFLFFIPATQISYFNLKIPYVLNDLPNTPVFDIYVTITL